MWELDHKESWVLKNWCFWIVVLDKTLESPLDCKEIQPVHLKGNQSWIFIGRTDVEAEIPILWPPDANNWFIWKDPDAGKDWRWEEKGMTEDEMVGWYHWLAGREFKQALGIGDGQGSLACCSPWGCRSRIRLSDWTEVALVVKNHLPMQKTSGTWARSLGWEDPLEEGMQPTPVFLSGESPWTEESGGLLSMGSQRVAHNWSDLAWMHGWLGRIVEQRGGRSQKGRNETVGWWHQAPIHQTAQVHGELLNLPILFFQSAHT